MRNTGRLGAMAVLLGCLSSPAARADDPPGAPGGQAIAPWLASVPEGPDRMLLIRMLDPRPAEREQAVGEWQAARQAAEREAQKASGIVQPQGRAPRAADWAEADDLTPPKDFAAAIRQRYWNRARAVSRGLFAALREGDAATRAAAARVLGGIGLPAGRHLVPALSDADPGVRMAVVEALVRLQAQEDPEPPALPALVRLLDDADAGVRAAAAVGVGAFRRVGDGSPEALDVRRRLVTRARDPDRNVRHAALRSLLAWPAARSEASRDADLFVEALADPDAGVRRVALAWLAEAADGAERSGTSIPRAEVTLPAARRLLGETDLESRYLAAHVVWRAARDTAAVLPVFTEAIATQRGRNLVRPLRDLAELGPAARPAVPQILAVLGEDTYARFFGSGVEPWETLYAVGPQVETTLPLLAGLLSDPDPERRARGACAFRCLVGDLAPCEAALSGALAREREPDVRAAIQETRGILGVGGEALIRDLLSSVGASDPERAAALRAFVVLGRRAASAEPVLARLAPRTLVDREAIFRARARIGGPLRAAEYLAHRGSWAGVGLRGGAAPWWYGGAAVEEYEEAVLAVGPGDVALVPALLERLDALPTVVPRALASIGPGAVPALPRLRAKMREATGEAQMAAAEAVLRLGGPDNEAVAALARALGAASPRDGDLRAAAAYAVARVGAPARALLPVLRAAADVRGLEDAGAAAFAVARLTGEGEPWVRRIVEAMERHQPRPPLHLVRALAAMGPAAAPASPVLERYALLWYRGELGRELDLPIAREAIRALGAIGPPARSALPTLEFVRTNALFRDVAEAAVARIRGP